LGKFFMFLQLKMSVYLMDTWSILRSFVIFYGHLVLKMSVYSMDTLSILRSFVIYYLTFGIVRGNLEYFSRFGILYDEKSGNPDLNHASKMVTGRRFTTSLEKAKLMEH
jgi:hypothetical protein